MKYKGLIFICLLICLFSIASVVASDVNETSVASEDQTIDEEMLTVEEQDVGEVGTTEEEELSASVGTFKDLANEIEEKCYKVNETEDKLYYSQTINIPYPNAENKLIANMGEDVNITFKVYSDYEYYKNGNISIEIGGKNYQMFKSKYNKIDDFNGTYDVYVTVNYIPKLSTPNIISQSQTTLYHKITCSPDNFHKGYYTGIYITWKNTAKIELNVNSTSLMLGEKVSFEVIAYDCYHPLSYIFYKDRSSNKKQFLLNSEGKTNFTREFGGLGLFDCVIDADWLHTSKKVQIEVYDISKISHINDIINTRGSSFKLELNGLDRSNNNIDGIFIVELDGKKYIFNSSSNIKLTIPKNVGSYNCKVIFQPYNKYLLSSSTTFKIISKYGTKVTVKSVTGHQGKKVKLTAKITDDAGKKLNNGKVILKINGKTYSATVKNGIAVITIKYPKAHYYDENYKNKGKYRYETTHYKSTYTCTATYQATGNYQSSSSTFKVTSNGKPIKHKYRIYNYKTFTLPVKKALKFYHKWSVVLAVGMKSLTTKNKLFIGVGDENDHMIKFKAKYHYKKNGKWKWRKWIKCKKDYYIETTYGKAIKIDKVKINCYSPYFVKIY